MIFYNFYVIIRVWPKRYQGVHEVIYKNDKQYCRKKPFYFSDNQNRKKNTTIGNQIVFRKWLFQNNHKDNKWRLRTKARNDCISFSHKGRPAGHPSTTTPIPFPWDSPQVVTRNRVPNVDFVLMTAWCSFLNAEIRNKMIITKCEKFVNRNRWNWQKKRFQL